MNKLREWWERLKESYETYNLILDFTAVVAAFIIMYIAFKQ